MRDNRKYIDKILDLCYPRRCPYCDEPVPMGEKLICNACRPKIRYIKEPRCKKCSKQLQDDAMMFCEDCRKRNHVFDCGYALYDYHCMSKSIYRYKYQGRCEYTVFYAQDVVRRLGAKIQSWKADALIPIPLHASRQNQRGYNQAELLSREITKLTGIPTRSSLVKRVRKTTPQKELDEVGRQNNLKRAFFINTDVVKLKRVILIDDIYTTGNTVNAVAKELKQRGVGEIYFITLCIGEGM